MSFKNRDVTPVRHTFREQRTIGGSARVQGFGYWSGKDVAVEFRPAAPHAGVVFVRVDQGERRIPALVQHRIETPRRTTLAANGASVEMVEHIMAALAGMRVDNCEVRVNSVEMPGCDGSSRAFVDALASVGVVGQTVTRPRLVITDVTRVGDDEAWVEARPSRYDGLSLKYRLDYGNASPIGRQTIELQLSPASFDQELASARTFILQHEAQWLQQQGLGRRVTPKDLLVLDDNGPVDNELRFEDECVRHKALDLVGDLALAGCDIVGHVTAHRSGHHLNAKLLRALLAEGRIELDRRRTA